MKKIFFFAMACLAMCLASCSLFEEKPDVVSWNNGNDVYKRITTTTKDGVKMCEFAKNDTTIIPAVAGAVISPLADFDAIVLTKEGDDSRTYYTMSGKQITDGPIRDFKKPGTFNTVVYIGVTQNNGTVLYFPADKKVVLTKSQFVDHKSSVLGYLTDEGFVLQSLKSGDVYVVKEKDAFFVICNGQDPKVVVPGKKTATITALNGDKVKDLPIKAWNQALNKAKKTKMDGITICHVVKLYEPLFLN